jgi:2-haloacid dehalogenase
MNASTKGVRLLLFDVFGTLVDWRNSIARSAEQSLSPLGLATDWHQFADAWRAQYQPAMEEVRSGRRAFCKLDVLHRRNLDVVLHSLGWSAQVDEATRQRLNLAWHDLQAWPDVTPGLHRLRAHARLAPCSNGNVSLMANLARHNGWHWDAVLGAEWARDYKPQSIVYTAAAAAFDCRPDEAMMVAAHSSDLAAAAACGLRTAFVARPDEQGPGLGESRPAVPVDLEVASLLELADQLGA